MQISAVPAPLTLARIGLELKGGNRLFLYLHIERRVCFVCHGEVREVRKLHRKPAEDGENELGEHSKRP
jgi:hypothetical protein